MHGEIILKMGYNQCHGRINSGRQNSTHFNNGRDYYENASVPMALRLWMVAAMRDNGSANILGTPMRMIFASTEQWNGAKVTCGSIYLQYAVQTNGRALHAIRQTTLLILKSNYNDIMIYCIVRSKCHATMW